MNAKVTRWLILPLAMGCAVASAQPAGAYPFQGDKQVQPGDERSPKFPAFPREENLVRIQVEGITNFDFFVDLESVSVESDGVVRYTVVARSGGATNIDYEGIRCAGRERKLYAIGRPDKTWSAARNPKWISISDLPVNRLQATLHDGYFCPARTIVRDTEEARKRLKTGDDSRTRDYTR